MIWSLSGLFGQSAEEVAARNLYVATVDQARRPEFYTLWQVPDSATGRFDVIALHAFLVLRRLKIEPDTLSFAEKYAGAIFEDMDRNLREMGVGDLSVGKKIRRLAEGFYGRCAAYERALDGGQEPLTAVIQRNLYGEAGSRDDALLSAVADYVRRCENDLAAQDVAALRQGTVAFAPMIQEMTK